MPELALQMGRPVRFGGEMRPFEERVRAMVDIAEEALAPVVPKPKEGFRRLIKRVPAGIVLVVAPWNYPYLTAVNSIVPALLAGNAVILKHATQTILVGDRFQIAMDRAGIPKGLFQNLALGHEDTAKLIGSGKVDHVNFTGSVAGGKAMERAAAGTFTTLGLELGGKDPAYVRADADFDFTVENVVDGTFYNSGQCCCGIEAHLRARQPVRPLRRVLRRPHQQVRPRQSAGRGDDARADGGDALRRRRARPDQ